MRTTDQALEGALIKGTTHKPASQALPHQNRREKDSSALVMPEPEQLVQLRASFGRIQESKDLVRLEYDLLQESQKCGLAMEDYRRLYQAHLNQAKSRGRDSAVWMRHLSTLLESAVAIALMIALVQYVSEAQSRHRLAVFTLLQLINSAQGQSANGGRIEAMQELVRYGESLAGVNAEKAYLARVRLPGANLEGAKFRGATLVGADLQGAKLSQVNLALADLRGANLQRAQLGRADLRSAKLFLAQLQNADLTSANLSGAILQGANLQGTKFGYEGVKFGQTNLERSDLSLANMEGAALYGVNLQKATLGGANLRKADLRQADLRWSNLLLSSAQRRNLTNTQGSLQRNSLAPLDLTEANLEGADLRGADLSMAQGLTQEQLHSAKLDRYTKLPATLYNPKTPLPPVPTGEQLFKYWGITEPVAPAPIAPGVPGAGTGEAIAPLVLHSEPAQSMPETIPEAPPEAPLEAAPEAPQAAQEQPVDPEVSTPDNSVIPYSDVPAAAPAQ
jgi:uncharacterized protein YjbI with pentapeptide repeats